MNSYYPTHNCCHVTELTVILSHPPLLMYGRGGLANVRYFSVHFSKAYHMIPYIFWGGRKLTRTNFYTSSVYSCSNFHLIRPTCVNNHYLYIVGVPALLATNCWTIAKNQYFDTFSFTLWSDCIEPQQRLAANFFGVAKCHGWHLS